MQIIGIDIGTTSICGVQIDARTGIVLKSETVNSNAFTEGKPFEKLQSCEKIIPLATQILDSLITRETVAIGVTGQMHGILYTDDNGDAVSPLYTWQDQRGNKPYKDGTYASYLGSHTGYGNVTDFYNRENGIRPKEAVAFCTIHDYLVMKLCGLKAPVIHSSDAASFGLYDIENNKFSIDVNAEVVNDYCIAGRYKGIPVAVAIGDNQASVFSTLADENAVLLNVGTGSQVSVVSDTPVMNDTLEARPYFDGKYLLVGAALCGGRAYSLLKDFYKKAFSYVENLSDEQIYSVMGQMLKEADQTTLKVDTRFAGTRKNAEVCGGIFGVTTENFTPENLTLGMLCGMVDELYGMYLEADVIKNGLIGSGNGVRKNKNFVKLCEKKFGTKMQIPTHTEEAAFGAALFAGISAGVFDSAKSAQKLIRYN